LTQEELEKQRETTVLKVPRRPMWQKGMTVTELERNENRAFLEWRRGIARIEQERSFEMTPYEKNIEIWKQFWRVVEMSDALMQIVDARYSLCNFLYHFVSLLFLSHYLFIY
jgi:large subunit GTPase 1